MAKIVLRDILTKISNLFKNDIYIYQRRYIIGGEISEKKNATRFVCVINVEYLELLSVLPEEPELLYLEEIKKSKDTILDDIKTDINNETKNEIIDFIKRSEQKFDKVKEWDNFNFSDEDKENIFDNNIIFRLFEKDNEIPEVIISKNLFPLVTKKNCDNLYYHVNLPKKKEELLELITSFDFDLFQIYNIITYLDLSVSTD